MKLKNCLIAAVLLGVSTPAIADASIESVPTSWRLQNYIGGDMVAYFTGTTCSYGSILIPFSASTDEKNRFWALVMTAKATGKTVGIYYETTSGTCRVTSFYEP